MLKRLARPIVHYFNRQFGDVHNHIQTVHQIFSENSYPINTHFIQDTLNRDERMMMLLGGLYTARVRALPPDTPLHEAEFSVFSQTGEDGIIQFLLAHIPNISKTFIEFGVENYVEANTRFLLKHDYWRGLVMDGSDAAVRYIQTDPIGWQRDLTVKRAFITKENINTLISEAGFAGEIGILSVDIDGNDYWVWDAIDVVQPTIVICEYNATFGDQHAITIPYQADFVRTKAHHSNLYFGASLPALYQLAQQKGYDFIGCNRMGCNAFFVRKDSGHLLKPVSLRAGFVSAPFSESRDENGALSFLKGQQKLLQIANCLVYDINTGETKTIREQFQLS
ncbi:MAG: hypothetical protein CUN52_05300 [Phototrophicales bacterium]|jgi:hypothetical protein|nr:MAG: hypothetical protein CUN52_05300 [Phototrophicales bacterium]